MNTEPVENEMNETGWPGDGSGTDDFADYNANEVDDYRNEGGDEDVYGDDEDSCGDSEDSYNEYNES